MESIDGWVVFRGRNVFFLRGWRGRGEEGNQCRVAFREEGSSS